MGRIRILKEHEIDILGGFDLVKKRIHGEGKGFLKKSTTKDKDRGGVFQRDFMFKRGWIT